MDPGETCDPPGTPAGGNGNLCRDDCTVCGDTIINGGEACDDGNGVNGDGCENDCTRTPSDHFKCYKTRGPISQQTVALSDQFLDSNATVSKLDRFCNPADKNSEGMNNPTAHLTCYKIKDQPRVDRQEVIVENQFGTQRLLITRADSLCVPSEKDGVPSSLNINHFKCYRVREPAGVSDFTELVVNVKDQFETKETRVKRARLLCNPVTKNDEPIVDPAAHLTCYNIKDVRGQGRFSPRQVDVLDQFTDGTIPTFRRDCRKVSFLCVPSTKRLASPSGAFLDMTSNLLD